MTMAAAGASAVGSLQEYCMKRNLPLPIYDLQNTSGPPHQPQFEILAKVGSIVTVGSGANKKYAKSAAATALLSKLKAFGSDVANVAGTTVNGINNVNGSHNVPYNVPAICLQSLVLAICLCNVPFAIAMVFDAD